MLIQAWVLFLSLHDRIASGVAAVIIAALLLDKFMEKYIDISKVQF